MPYRIGLLLIDGFALMSYAAAVEPLRAANLLAGEMLYEICHIGCGSAVCTSEVCASGVCTSSGGAKVPATGQVGRGHDFDLVLVVAGGDPIAFRDPPTFQWLRLLSRKGVKLGGVSGGPAVLALAGLMEGRRMTVHWEHAAALSELAPGLMLERTLYVIDRDRISCAGGTAPLDLMHALITEQHGAAFARRVSDWFLHTEVRQSAGPQRAGLSQRYGTTSLAVLLAIEAMENHIADPLALDQLARLSGVSPRHLNRLFREKLGSSTMEFYRRLRLEKARSLLQQLPMSITEIALATGFSNPGHFAICFRENFGFTPSSARAR